MSGRYPINYRLVSWGKLRDCNGLRDPKPHDETAAATLVLGRQACTHRLANSPFDGQSQTDAANSGFAGGGGAEERLEDVWEFGRRDSGAPVLDGKRSPPVAGCDSHSDRRTCRRVLDRVVHQVFEQLSEQFRMGADARGCGHIRHDVNSRLWIPRTPIGDKGVYPGDRVNLLQVGPAPTLSAETETECVDHTIQ